MAYKIVNNMLPTSKYGIKAPYAMNPLYITVHNTGNTASARNEAAYHNSNNAQVSYHVAIDDKEAVQLIPFNRTAWHAGDGMGNGNMRSIGIEICYSMDNGYSGAKSARYKAAEENAALYIAYVLKQYGWGMDRLKRHYDWSGKDCPHKMHATGTYQAFRNRIQAHLNALNSNSSKPAKKPTNSKKSTTTIVNEVIAGEWGTGNARFNALRKAGYNPTTIQNAVNKKLGASPSKPAKKSIDTVAREVIAGKWGNGNARFNALKKAGYNANAVQKRVNQLL